MKLPRNIRPETLASLLSRYGYRVTRQTGSHMRLTSDSRGFEHHITIPRYTALRIGTLGAILSEVASYRDVHKQQLVQELFGR
ncbi:MAG: type II toxin-antitoxin system HicA family toxin [Acidobacteria bacterium]|nr:type II toxin-antitoxin system HicA family toxin [Acidobacteriota bacterium]